MINVIFNLMLVLCGISYLVLLLRSVKEENIRKSLYIICVLAFIDSVYLAPMGLIKLIATPILVFFHINKLQLNKK